MTPILIPCEGTDQRTHAVMSPVGQAARICTMCGHVVSVRSDGTANPHQRDDLLARIDRGDFG